MNIKYFDNAATTRIKEAVLEEMFPYLSLEYGNPSSIYSLGRRQERLLKRRENELQVYYIVSQMKLFLQAVVQKVIIWH